jgi:D-3-phosphoglycerate dehydrogenase
MYEKQFFIIDFDSTFIKVEALDELAKIVLQKSRKKQKVIDQIQELTELGMDGIISFSESLSKRLSLLSIKKKHLNALTKLLKKNITPSIERNKEFFKKYADSIYVLSGGFKEYIVPVVKQFEIKEDHILANTFRISYKGDVKGYDSENLLSQENGKAKQLKKLKLNGKIYIVGDGYSDYEASKVQSEDSFVAFIENIKRDSVLKKADIIISNFDELLFQLKLPRALSYPKSKMKVLLLEKLDLLAVEMFQKEGYEVEALSTALDENELIEKIKDVHILGIRSKTEVSSKVIEHAKKLRVIGAFCIGTNQIDVAACTEQGIAVFNAPYSNTRSVVELVLGEIIMLSRKTFEKSSKLHKGIWDKSSEGSREIRGKKLGIIGYGNIGSQLSVLAEMVGMEVYFYDITDKLALGNAKKCESLKDLLKISDIVTVHVDGRASNTNLIDEPEFKAMKNGVIFLNLSRGVIVNIEALAAHIQSGKIAGAAVDVFPKEPKNNKEAFISQLQNLPNVILTPHIGGSTQEAQYNIAGFVSTKLIEFINIGATVLSTNMPQLQLSPHQNAHRCIHIHANVPGMMAHINEILAKNNINIEGQYLKTNESIGYVITDIDKNYDPNIIETLKKIPGTIKFRVLY